MVTAGPAILPQERNPVSLFRRLSGPHNGYRLVRQISSQTGFDPRIDQRVASRYTTLPRPYCIDIPKTAAGIECTTLQFNRYSCIKHAVHEPGISKKRQPDTWQRFNYFSGQENKSSHALLLRAAGVSSTKEFKTESV